MGGDDPAAEWQNATINSTWISDIGDFVKEGDSVFRLSKIGQPPANRQHGVGGYTGGYASTSQILTWNGLPLLNADGTEGQGAYESRLINEVVLYAKVETPGVDYNGAGKIFLASQQEVFDGTSNNKAVVPSDLYTGYLRTDISNIPNADKQAARDNLGITEEYALHDMSNVIGADKQTARDDLDIDAEFIRLDAINIQDPDPIRTALGFALPSEPNIFNHIYFYGLFIRRWDK